MARPSKTEVSAINIRIPSDKTRDYSGLVGMLLEQKIAIRVYGTSFISITQFNAVSGIGVISKYSEIDVDGDWFDVEEFASATPEQMEKVSIPDRLRPNHAAFYFKLFEVLHLVVFASYSE